MKGFCKYCDTSFVANATRMRCHLTEGCPKAPPEVKELYRKEVVNQSVASSRKRMKIMAFRSLPTDNVTVVTGSDNEDSDSISETSSISHQYVSKISRTDKEPSHSQSTVSISNNQNQCSILPFIDRVRSSEQTEIEESLTKAIYVTASPLILTDNHSWCAFFEKIRPGFQIPSRQNLSGPLLMKEKNRVSDYVRGLCKDSPSIGMSADGWSCISNDSHIQVLCMTPTPFFFKSIHSEEMRHTAKFMSDIICNAIDEFCEFSNVEAKSIRFLVTDNAANMISAWIEIRNRFPWINTYGCLAHGLNFLASDMRKVLSISTVIAENSEISKFFRYRHVSPIHPAPSQSS